MPNLPPEVVVLIAFVLGITLGYLFCASLNVDRKRSVPDPQSEEQHTVQVKRTKPSLRNPMRTYNTEYDDFKTKRGLYEPVKPRGVARKQEDELEV